MPTITTKDGTEIFYKDWGSGQPITFSHGWPLSFIMSDDFEPGKPPLLANSDVIIRVARG